MERGAGRAGPRAGSQAPRADDRDGAAERHGRAHARPARGLDHAQAGAPGRGRPGDGRGPAGRGSAPGPLHPGQGPGPHRHGRADAQGSAGEHPSRCAGHAAAASRGGLLRAPSPVRPGRPVRQAAGRGGGDHQRAAGPRRPAPGGRRRVRPAPGGREAFWGRFLGPGRLAGRRRHGRRREAALVRAIRGARRPGPRPRALGAGGRAGAGAPGAVPCPERAGRVAWRLAVVDRRVPRLRAGRGCARRRRDRRGRQGRHHRAPGGPGAARAAGRGGEGAFRAARRAHQPGLPLRGPAVQGEPDGPAHPAAPDRPDVLLPPGRPRRADGPLRADLHHRGGPGAAARPAPAGRRAHGAVDPRAGRSEAQAVRLEEGRHSDAMGRAAGRAPAREGAPGRRFPAAPAGREGQGRAAAAGPGRRRGLPVGPGGRRGGRRAGRAGGHRRPARGRGRAGRRRVPTRAAPAGGLRVRGRPTGGEDHRRAPAGPPALSGHRPERQADHAAVGRRGEPDRGPVRASHQGPVPGGQAARRLHALVGRAGRQADQAAAADQAAGEDRAGEPAGGRLGRGPQPSGGVRDAGPVRGHDRARGAAGAGIGAARGYGGQGRKGAAGRPPVARLPAQRLRARAQHGHGDAHRPGPARAGGRLRGQGAVLPGRRRAGADLPADAGHEVRARYGCGGHGHQPQHGQGLHRHGMPAHRVAPARDPVQH